MQMLTEEQKKLLGDSPIGKGVMPQRPSLWFTVLEAAIRVLTGNRARLIRDPGPKVPIKWDGNIR